MAEDQVLADLQRPGDASPDAAVADPLEELEALAEGHEQRMNTLTQEFQAKYAALEAKIAARLRDAEIERIKSELKSA